MIYTKVCPFFLDIGSVTHWLTTFFSERGDGKTLENKQHVSDPGSTETVSCSENKDDPGQNVAWYRLRTAEKIKSGGRFDLKALSLKITNVQLDDAGTYECRRVSSRQYLTIYVNGEFSLLLVIWAPFVLSPNHNAILLFLMFRCFVIDFIVKSLSWRSLGKGVHFTGFVETCPV